MRHKLPFVVTIPDQTIQRANTSNRERRRTSESRARRHVRFRNEMKTSCRLEEVDQFRDQFESFFL